MVNITEQTKSGMTVYVVDGRIDSTGAVDLDLALQSATADGRYNIVIDLAKVSYINSAGLRTLADILTQCRENNGDLRLVALHPRVKRVFQIIGFDNFFSIYESLDEAVAASA